MHLREDGPRHQGARKRMLDKLQPLLETQGLYSEEVREAMMSVPRHVFFDSAFDTRFAYENSAFQIGAGQTISQPFTVASQSKLLDVTKRQKVLEIGTGSGYQAAVLGAMGLKVYSIERQKLLYDTSRRLLPSLGFRINQYYGDGFAGLPGFAPFDGIIVTCGAPFVPQALLHQLAVGGNLVIPVGEGEKQVMKVLKRVSEKEFEQTEYGTYSFVPMLEKTQR